MSLIALVYVHIVVAALAVGAVSGSPMRKTPPPSCADYGRGGKDARVLHTAVCNTRAKGIYMDGAWNSTGNRLISSSPPGRVTMDNACALTRWGGFLTKPLKYREYVSKLLSAYKARGLDPDESAVVMLTDSDTMWSVRDVETVLRKYDCVRRGRHLVMATETSCWVGRYCLKEDIDLFYSQLQSTSYSSFMNSGLLIGAPTAVLSLLEDIIVNNATYVVPKYMGSLKYDDQYAFAHYMRKHPEAVALDYHQVLFGSFSIAAVSPRNHTVPFVCEVDAQQGSEMGGAFHYNCDETTPRVIKHGVYAFDEKQCTVVRDASKMKDVAVLPIDKAAYKVLSTLAPDPIIWHGNGAGKRISMQLSQRAVNCFERNP
jgi:hypothetical protein